MTGHIGTNARPNLYPPAGDDRRLTLLKRGCANSVVGLELAEGKAGNNVKHAHGAKLGGGRDQIWSFCLLWGL